MDGGHLGVNHINVFDHTDPLAIDYSVVCKFVLKNVAGEYGWRCLSFKVEVRE